MRYILVCLMILAMPLTMPLTLSMAQTPYSDEVTTVVVLPFDARGNAQSYSLSLAIALARHLNVVDYVYTPPVGDVLLTINRLQEEGKLSVNELASNYNADYVVSGRVELSGSDSLQARVQLGFADRESTFDNADLNVNLNDPNGVIESVVLAALAKLQLTPSSNDRNEIEAVLAQAPSLASLQVVSQSASRIQVPNFSQLEAAASLDPNSSWVMTERARAATLNSALENARRFAEEAVRLNARDHEAWMVLAQISALQNDMLRSQQALDAVLGINPSYAEALMVQGQVLQRLGEGARAQESLRHALLINPRLVDAYTSLAELQVGGEALQTIRRGTLMVPESRNLQRAFVAQAVALGDNAGALRYIEQRLEASNDPRDYELLALLDADTEAAITLAQQGQSFYPMAIEPLLAEANLQLRQDNAAVALDRLRQALSIQPDNLLVRNQLALTYARQGNLEQAVSILEQASNSSTLQFNLAQVYLEAGQYQAAIDALEPFLDSYANDAEALTIYAVALSQVGRNDQALNVVERALQLSPNNSNLQDLATQLAAAGTGSNLPEGIQQVEMSEQQQVIFQRGQEQLEADQPASAMAEFSNARAYGDNGLLAFYEGLAAQASGDAARAVLAYTDALAMIGESSTLLNNLGFAHYQNGNPERALEYLQQAVTLDENNGQAQLNLALVSYSLGNIAVAAPALQRALALDSSLAESTVQIDRTDELTQESQVESISLADLNSRLQQQVAGQGELAQALGGANEGGFDTLITGDARLYFDDGRAALAEGNPSMAAENFTSALVYGDNPIISFYLGYAEQALGNYDTAITAYEVALESSPESALVLNNLGFAYYLRGQDGDAEEGLGYLARAVQADPNNIRAHINLGLVSYSLGRYRSALTPLERAISLNPALESTELDFADGSMMTLGALIAQTREQLGQ